MIRGIRGPQPRDPEPHWIAVRYVEKAVDCSFCGYTIPRGKPGTRTGERGTKAYFNKVTREWECLGCRNEAVRAALAREPAGAVGSPQEGR